MTKASEIKNIIMASMFGAEYKDAAKITEVWKDTIDQENNIYCLRIADIFYDILVVNPIGVSSVIKGITTSKPSVLSKVLGRIIVGDSGSDVTHFDWEKLSDKEIITSQRNLLTGDYSDEKLGMRVMWGDDMALHAAVGLPALTRITTGPVTVEQARLLKSAIDAYILRCDKFLNPRAPQPRKPRTKKVITNAVQNAPAQTGAMASIKV